MIKLPGQTEQRTVHSPVGLCDIIPTVIDYQGGDTSAFHGRSLKEWCEGKQQHDEPVLITWWGKDKINDSLPDYMAHLDDHDSICKSQTSHWRTIISADGIYKYTLTEFGEQVLYNLKDDPYEKACCLATTDEATITDLRQLLQEKLDAIGDSDFNVEKADRQRLVTEILIKQFARAICGGCLHLHKIARAVKSNPINLANLGTI